MYLKNIEVQGFKSFAQKINFEFHNGITGIVGPNGSGKSNVGDAVRWVLGEQSARSLRGGNMQDVIFSGTETRKPLGYASVAITLDNSDHKLPVDFNEVTVTRRLYRSGESEYKINGSACRLKDINEMFYDTGIGKEGYSSIGQGQIDKILSGKPEERRELFDEAAGIVKFKRRKALSLRKLEEEQSNLVRVNDILGELEKQFGPLQKQSEKAKEYLKKREELKHYDINMFLVEMKRLKGQIRENDEKLKIAQDELTEAGKKHEDMKAQYEKIEQDVEEIDAGIEHAKSQRNETTLLKQQLENQIELLKEQINSVRMNDEHYEKRANDILANRERQKSELEEEKAEIDRHLAAASERQKQAGEELTAMQSRIAEMTVEIEKNQNDIRELLNNRASTKAKLQHYETTLEQIKVRRALLYKRLVEAESDVQRQQELAAQYTEELKAVSGKITDSVEQIKNYETEIAGLQKEIGQANENLRNRQNAYHREYSRLESLRNLTERYDGYGNSIRRVMEQKSREPKILGVVADLIKVDKKYETAVEIALGGSIQNIVTADEETAKKMIGYLKQNRYGRATFLPLTAIHGGQGFARAEALREPGVIGTADKLVTVEDKFISLAEHLLGRTLVADNIDTGIRLARKYRQSLRIVTLEGDLINPGGAMSGGAFKNSSNLLSRRREIEELEKAVARLKTELQKSEAEVAAAKEKRTALYAKVEEIQQELQNDYVVQNTAKMNLDQVKSRQNATRENSEGIYAERKKLEEQVHEIEENEESIKMELETSQQLEDELTRQMESSQKWLEKEREAEAAEVRKNENIHLSFAALEQKKDFIEENFVRIREEMGKFQEELATLNASKGENHGEIEQKEAQITEIRQTIENSKELFEEINKEIEESQKKREELNQKHKAFLKKREDLAAHMAELDKESFRLTSKKEGYEEALEKQINYMWEEYELTYNHALEIRDESLTDPAEMRRRIQELKTEIRKLGSVNVNAIEDFKNLSERYEFMKTQHDDLVEAEATLKKIIEELDEAMRKQFTEQFAKISQEFNQVFKQLFGC